MPLQRPIKLVLDTNVLVAAFFSRESASSQLLGLAINGEIQLLWSSATLREMEKVLGNIEKATGRPGFFARVKECLFTDATKVTDPPDVRECEDPADDKFLACGAGGAADWVVSNDPHLLRIGNFRGIAIVTPAFALARINA